MITSIFPFHFLDVTVQSSADGIDNDNEDDLEDEFHDVDEEISFKAQGNQRTNTLSHLLDTLTVEQGESTCISDLENNK